MRHKQREILDRQRLDELLDGIGHGTFASAGPNGWPILRAVNFVRIDTALYFHGAHQGEKMEALGADDRVTFLAVKEFSLIPSWFTDAERACPATQFFQSVLVRGRASVVDEPEEKARALQALMEKLQPEGRHEPITARDPLYAASIAGTAVVRIDIEEITGKDNVGQDKSGQPAEQIETGLRERGTPLDQATLEAMERSRASDL